MNDIPNGLGITGQNYGAMTEYLDRQKAAGSIPHISAVYSIGINPFVQLDRYMAMLAAQPFSQDRNGPVIAARNLLRINSPSGIQDAYGYRTAYNKIL